MVTLSGFGHIAQMTRLCSIPLPKGRRDDNLGNYTERSQTKLSSRPERTRISCHTAPETWPRVRLSVRERRMKCTNATKVNRKSGGAEWRDLRCASRPSRIPRLERESLLVEAVTFGDGDVLVDR